MSRPRHPAARPRRRWRPLLLIFAAAGCTTTAPEGDAARDLAVAPTYDLAATTAEPDLTMTRDATPPPDPLLASPRCTSDAFTVPDGGSDVNMEPGGGCIVCHRITQRGPSYQFAGTVYATGHEPDGCNAGAMVGGARIVITDATGKEISLEVHLPSGNFGYGGAPGQPELQMPFTARVLYQGRERAMSTPQSLGDCNICHTSLGIDNAPGRITLP